MNTVYTFSAPVRLGLEEIEASAVDEKIHFLGVLCENQKLQTEKIVRLADQKLYYQVQQGFVAVEDVYLLDQTLLGNYTPLAKKRQGRIKSLRGTTAYTMNGKRQLQLAFKVRVAFVAGATSILKEKWLQTEEGLWLKEEDCWLAGTSIIKEKQRIDPTLYLQVVAPLGTIVYDKYGELVTTLKQESRKAVSHRVTDCFTQSYWQIGEDQFVRSSDCFVSEDPVRISFDDYHLLQTENISQNSWQAINGCEAAALLEGFHFQGKLTEKNYQQWLDLMPISPDYDPYHGFGGSPYYNQKGCFEAIFPPALLKWGRKYGSLRDLSGLEAKRLKEAILRGNPCLVYVTVDFEKGEADTYPWGDTYANNHAVLLDGFTADLWHLSDPIGGHYWIDDVTFRQSYELRFWAIEILKNRGESLWD